MQPLWYFIAFVIVVALIGAAAWLVRRFSGNSMGGGTARGRMPRLAVIDAATVDGRRRLVLVRRDNVEHLLIIGGPTDVVVETNIVRGAAGQRDQASRAPAGTELPARVSPLPDATSWGADNDGGRAETFEMPEPAMPERPAPRPPRVEEPRRPAAAETRSADLGSIVPEPMVRPEPAARPSPVLRAEPRPARTEPAIPRPPRPPELPSRGPAAMTRPAPRPAEQPMSAADQNLAEMAQRLEAALRRPAAGGSEHRPPSAAPSAPSVSQADRIGAPPVAPEAPAGRPASETDNPPTPPKSHEPAPKSGFENLEDEMANLLGRPKNQT
ncbi:flagellar biosynthetic protein FliO [Afipia sp. TerB]